MIFFLYFTLSFTLIDRLNVQKMHKHIIFPFSHIYLGIWHGMRSRKGYISVIANTSILNKQKKKNHHNKKKFCPSSKVCSIWSWNPGVLLVFHKYIYIYIIHEHFLFFSYPDMIFFIVDLNVPAYSSTDLIAPTPR